MNNSFHKIETLDGRESKSVLTLESPTRLVHVQKDAKSGKVVTTIVREIVGDNLVQVNIEIFNLNNIFPINCILKF